MQFINSMHRFFPQKPTHRVSANFVLMWNIWNHYFKNVDEIFEHLFTNAGGDSTSKNSVIFFLLTMDLYFWFDKDFFKFNFSHIFPKKKKRVLICIEIYQKQKTYVINSLHSFSVFSKIICINNLNKSIDSILSRMSLSLHLQNEKILFS